MTWRSWSAVLGAAAISNLLLFAPLPLEVQAVAMIVLSALLPGLLLVEAVVGRSTAPPTLWERILYAVATGIGIMVVVMLGLSYLPGGVSQWQTLLAFNGVTAFLLGITALRLRRPVTLPRHEWREPGVDLRWFMAGLLLLALTGGLLRFLNLGYADFQGDEARAALRAAAVIRGYDDVLMLHKKGPTEILIPTVLYSGTGHLTEATARLTFAIANFVALFAVWLLGWRLFHPLAGWLAAMLVLLDGYFIGFGRIVQYQSVVLLCTVLAVYAVWRLVREPRGLAPWLSLAAISAAIGLLSHYEGALVALPIAILWGVLYWRNRERQREVWVATAIAVAVGGAVLASFYLPYVLHPRFAATYYYLTDRRIGNSFPYNNLADVFLRTTLYSTTYYVVGMIVVTVAGMVRSFRRGLSPLWGNLLGSATVLFVAYTALRPEWFTLGSGEMAKDQIGFLFLGLMVLLALLPRAPLHERLLWIWFGAVMVLALFFTEKPRTHVYTFFIPWLLLNGILLAEGWLWLVAKVGRPVGQVLGAAAAALATLVFGVYAFWYFVSPSEVMMNYATERPAGYWVTYDEPDDKARFGFPLNNGWKAIGELYRQGVLDGYFDSSEKEAWVPAWYTRGEERCPREAEWFFEIRNLEPFSNEDFLEMEHYLRNGFEKVGKVQVAGEDKVIIYQRTGAKHDSPTAGSNADLPAWQFEELAAAFDQTALAGLPLTYPSVDPPIAHPMNYNFGDLITLEGYDISYPEPLAQGDTIRLTLYWRAQQPIPANYKVFTQAYGPDNRMVAQRDGYPVCDGRETWRWDPGELITDFYDIPVLADAPDGLYPLYAGFYLEETGDRLTVFDESGAEVGSQVKVAEFRIGVE